MARDGRGFPKFLFIGLLVIAVGVVFLLDQIGVLSADHIFRYFWPAALIFWGAENILSCRRSGRFWGVFLVLAGGLLLLSNLGYLHVTFNVIWPTAIIFWGIWIIVQSLGRTPRAQGEWAREVGDKIREKLGPTSHEFDSAEPNMNYDAVFSHVDRRIVSKNFRGGKLAAVFGGFKLDLRQAEIEGDQAVIHVDTVFGGGEIIVPPTWQISTPQTPAVFGFYRNETNQQVPPGGPAKRLVVKGAAVFGGVIIKN
jgi:predicted membrane protein